MVSDIKVPDEYMTLLEQYARKLPSDDPEYEAIVDQIVTEAIKNLKKLHDLKDWW
jgi:hypothetical protein